MKVSRRLFIVCNKEHIRKPNVFSFLSNLMRQSCCVFPALCRRFVINLILIYSLVMCLDIKCIYKSFYIHI